VFSGARVLRGRDFRPHCKNRPVSKKPAKLDSRSLQTSLTLGLPEPRVSFVLASHVHAKSVTPKLAEESAHPDASSISAAGMSADEIFKASLYLEGDDISEALA